MAPEMGRGHLCRRPLICNFFWFAFGLWERFSSSELVDDLTAITRVNRGGKLLPLTINYSFKDIELSKVSSQMRLWPEKTASLIGIETDERRTSNVK